MSQDKRRVLILGSGSSSTPSAAVPISGTSIDWSAGSTRTKTLDADTTFTFSNATDGQTITVAITNTASDYAVTWPVSVVWTGGTAPTQTLGIKTDIYTFKKIGSTVYGTVVPNF